MKSQMFLTFISSIFLFLTSLSISNGQDNYSKNDKVVKIIKTKCYSTKNSFDKLIIDLPAYDMGYDLTMGMDFSWSIKYFDKFNNILKLENFNIDKNGKEVIYQTKMYEYYLPDKHQLSVIKTTSLFGIEKEIFVRDKSGKLLQVIEYDDTKMRKKTIFSYNNYGQIIKEEVYYEKGLEKYYEYIYNSTEKVSSYLINKIEVDDNKNYRKESEYLWSEDGKNIKTNIKESKNGETIAERTIHYNNYVDDIVTEEIVEGNYAPLRQVSIDGNEEVDFQREFMRKTTIKTLNSFNDILTYSNLSVYIDESYQIIFPYPNLRIPVEEKYICEYKYNKKNEWTELLFFADKTKYLIVRNIKYFD